MDGRHCARLRLSMYAVERGQRAGLGDSLPGERRGNVERRRRGRGHRYHLPGRTRRRAEPVHRKSLRQRDPHVQSPGHSPDTRWLRSWISGTPNDAKDAIAPLTAVVEADWMPFTFSMNWRFTRTKHCVRFAKGEPFCFFTPIKRQSIEDFVPQLRPLSADPHLMQTYAGGKARRNVMTLLGTEPSERFQGWYARGVQPDGGEEPHLDHRTKNRPRPFERC